MQRFSASPREMLASFLRNRGLIKELVKREVIGRYKGSYMGILWSFFNPILMLAVYTFVFSVVFKARWNTNSESKGEFALILFAGLILFNIFSECITKAPGIILYNANYVKKVVFPLEILPWVSLGAALFHGAISLAVWLAVYIFTFGLPPATALLLPTIIVPFALFILGLSWTLSALGVFLRDTSQFIGIATTAILFMSPIFYPISAIPEDYRQFLFMNPLTLIIEQGRNLLYWGITPSPYLIIGYTAGATTIAWLGFVLFQKTRKGFADVI
ncbi:ABC transporter permease [Pseudomonas sp. LABIM340]|uniref:ABC transporter permease n=1 Tax=Pseudomonas sp. LABIM340 TaxID=3156585 RepID=UPI0032AE8B58